MNNAPPVAGVTEDRLLGGRVSLRQPKQGYRVAIDPVLLAAAAQAKPGERIADLGTGTGAVALCLLARCADIHVTGIEIQAGLATIARENVAANGRRDRCTIIEGDIAAGTIPGAPYDGVVANPPYAAAGRGTLPPEPGRAIAHAEGETGLDAWIDAALGALRPKGWLAFILPAGRVDAAVARLHGRAGEIALLPLWPHEGELAKRVIVTARKGVKGGARIQPGLVLHQTDGRYTPATRRVLEDGLGIAQALSGP
jgi:tRNA1(Val) A37 N6-methylase TrmN6